VPGSIRMVRDKDTWELRVYVGRDESGRVRHRHATFHGSKREAERALARLVVVNGVPDPSRCAFQPANALLSYMNGTLATSQGGVNGWERHVCRVR
jgi:hypothetical protein